MARQVSDRSGLAVPSNIINEAFHLLEKLSSSGLSTKWRISSWNGMVSLLLVWGKKKRSRRGKDRPSSSRKRSLSKKKSSGKKRQQGGVFPERSSAGSSLMSSPVYTEFSSDEARPPSYPKRRKDTRRAPVSVGSVLSADSIFSVDSLRKPRDALTSMSSYELSNEEAFLYDSLKRRKAGHDSERSVYVKDCLRPYPYIASDEPLYYDSLTRSDGGKTGLSNDEVFAEDSHKFNGYEERVECSREVSSFGSQLQRELSLEERLEHRASEQLKAFSDETLMYESLRRKKAQVHSRGPSNEIYDVSKYKCDDFSRKEDQQRRLEVQMRHVECDVQAARKHEDSKSYQWQMDKKNIYDKNINQNLEAQNLQMQNAPFEYTESDNRKIRTVDVKQSYEEQEVEHTTNEIGENRKLFSQQRETQDSDIQFVAQLCCKGSDEKMQTKAQSDVDFDSRFVTNPIDKEGFDSQSQPKMDCAEEITITEYFLLRKDESNCQFYRMYLNGTTMP